MAANNGEETVSARRPDGRGWPYRAVVAVGVVGLLVTVGLIVVSTILYHNNENRLLKLRTRDIGSVLTAAVPSVLTSVGSTATFAEATNGNAGKFDKFAGQYVGQGSGRPFASMSLWRVDNPAGGPTTVVGAQPKLAATMDKAPALFARAAATHKLTVLGLLDGPAPRIGYAFVEPGTNGPYAVYAESALPAKRYSAPQTDSSFTDINYALYLGKDPTAKTLLITSAPRVPLPGHRAVVTIPFGDTFLTVRATRRSSLAGSLPRDLPWLIGIVGVLLTIGAAALTIRLIQRRRRTEQLADRLEQVADENRRLYAEQRSIAQTLQHALLPAELPQLHGLQTSARYEAGVEGVDIGGDWYDAIAVDDKRLLLVVGDVSGRGLRAATTMAALRYGIHAYAAQGDKPATILTKLNALVSVKSSGQLATVLCVMVDPDARELTLTSAGHLPPLLISDGRGEFVKTDVGLPIGVDRHASYTSTTVTVAPGATLLAFTDGLVERRGESIDVGLGRLREHATSNHATLDELLTRVVSNLREDGSDDDTAIAGIRWLS
ncbi:MAG TPA: PP2C family protein-serine/threonine phosphatase [Solirubrobacteraceae bacterium]|nr:PP2C family protein-serine/threonine phosphatase [Solirubrobacteraceae bacterium]